MKNLKNLNLKNTENLKLSLRTILEGITSITVRMNATESAKFKDRTEQKRKAKMKTILLALITIINFNYASADENAPVNFHIDKVPGQYTFKVNTRNGDQTTSAELKVCKAVSSWNDQGTTNKDCLSHKTKDTEIDVEYLVNCVGKPPVNILCTRYSNTDYSCTSKVEQTVTAFTYKYIGPNCDSDAIKQ